MNTGITGDVSIMESCKRETADVSFMKNGILDFSQDSYIYPKREVDYSWVENGDENESLSCRLCLKPIRKDDRYCSYCGTRTS